MFVKNVCVILCRFTRMKHQRNIWQSNLKTMKINTPQFKALFTPELTVLSDIFKRHAYELRIAGGAVRDLLMDLQPVDIDFATTATPAEMKSMFESEEIRMINNKGEKHGTITARINDVANFEVTTLRIDKITDGRHAVVEFTTDWEVDASRRDLTINAMFLGLDGTVYDYFHGIDDVEQRRVRFVGDPATRIREDYLRILRYFRFYGRIAPDANSLHDADTISAIRENVDGLKGISGERILTELRKILTGNYVPEIVETMAEVGVTTYIGFPDSFDAGHFRRIHRRVQGLTPHPLLLLAAICKNEDDVMQVHNRLKMSAYERDLIRFVVVHRDDKPECVENSLRPYQKLVFSTTGKQSDVQQWTAEVLKYRGDEKLLGEFERWVPPKFPVKGDMLVSRGLRPGPRFAVVLAHLRNIWFESDFTLSADELLEKLPDVLNKIKAENADQQLKVKNR